MNLRQSLRLPMALLALVASAAFAQDTKTIRQALTTSASAQVTSLAGFKDPLRANAERASFGVPVVSGSPSMVGVALQKCIGLPLTAVPYRISSPVVTNVADGQVTGVRNSLADAMPMVKEGRVWIFAVIGFKRSCVVPDVSTFEELGVLGLTTDSCYAFFAPAGLPAVIAERFNLALANALADSEIKQKITDLSIELPPTALKQADDVLKSAARYWLNA